MTEINSIKDKERLCTLIYKMTRIPIKDIKSIISTEDNAGTNDISIYQKLIKLLPENDNDYDKGGLVRPPIGEVTLVTSPDNYDNYEKMSNRVRKQLAFLKNININTFIDFGGSDGSLAKAVHDLYMKNTPESKAYSIDIKEWYGSTITPKYSDINYIELDNNAGTNSLSLIKDDSVDLVTCFQVLHHIIDIDPVMSELVRKLHIGGYLLIREHDANTDDIKKIIDVEHAIYEVVLKKMNESESKKFLDNYCAWYHSKFEWTNMLKVYGLVYQKHIKYYKLHKSSTNYYYALYKKNQVISL